MNPKDITEAFHDMFKDMMDPEEQAKRRYHTERAARREARIADFGL